MTRAHPEFQWEQVDQEQVELLDVVWEDPVQLSQVWRVQLVEWEHPEQG